MHLSVPRWAISALVIGSALVGAGGANPVPAAYMPEFEDCLIIAPNGRDTLPAYYVEMIGAGEDELGGGQTIKVGLGFSIYYMRFTRGGGDFDWVYDPLFSPSSVTLAGPPDLTDMSQLPSEVLDDLDLEGNYYDVGCLPRLIAYLEWARYLNIPYVIHLNGGPVLGGGHPYEYSASYHIEKLETPGYDWAQCQWNEWDRINPSNDPKDMHIIPESNGATFAQPTMADDAVGESMNPPVFLKHRHYKKRNLQAAINGILHYASLPRYAGRLAAFTTDSETHLQYWPDPATGERWYCDYNPVAIRQFQMWAEAYYGDDTPVDDSNGDGVTFATEYGTEYLDSGNSLHPHLVLPGEWCELDPPRNPRRDLWKEAIDPCRYWMFWTNFRMELLDEWLEEVSSWITDCGVPPERLYGHEDNLAAALFKNRVVPEKDSPKDGDVDARALERDYACLGSMHYGSGDHSDTWHFFEHYRRIDWDWTLGEYNPYVLGNGQWASPEDVASNVQMVYDNGVHVLCPQAVGLSSHPAVEWTEYNFAQGDLHGWTTNDDLVHHQNAVFYTTGIDPMLISPTYTNLDAEEVNYVVTSVRVPPGGNALQLFWQREGDAGFSAERVVTLTPKSFPLSECQGWIQYVFQVGEHSLWNGQIERLRFDPVSDDVGTMQIHYIALVGHNPLSEALRDLVAAHDGQPKPNLKPVASPVPASLTYLDDYIDTPGFQMYGAGEYDDFDPEGDFMPGARTCGGQTLNRSILAPPPLNMGQVLVGAYRLLLPRQWMQLKFKVGLADGGPATNEGVRFEVALRDEHHRLWHLQDIVWREQEWSGVYVVDLADFAGQEVTLSLRTHAIADAVGDNAVWGNPRLVTRLMPEPVGRTQAAADEFLVEVTSADDGPRILLQLGSGLPNEDVVLTVYDVEGHVVKRLLAAPLPSGRHAFSWDGRSNTGGRMPSGLYLVRAVRGKRSDQGRLLLVR